MQKKSVHPILFPIICLMLYNKLLFRITDKISNSKLFYVLYTICIEKIVLLSNSKKYFILLQNKKIDAEGNSSTSIFLSIAFIVSA